MLMQDKTDDVPDPEVDRAASAGAKDACQYKRENPSTATCGNVMCDKDDKHKRSKRRRIMPSSHPGIANNAGIFGQIPDASALINMAAQAAVQLQPQLSDYGNGKHVIPGSSALAVCPQSVLQQSLGVQHKPQNPLQLHSRQSLQGEQTQQVSFQAAQALSAPSVSYGTTLLQNMHAPYALHPQQTSVGLQQIQQAPAIGQTGYYNYIPFPVRPDTTVATPSWNNMAVATSLGMVSTQSPWILPMAHMASASVCSVGTSVSQSTDSTCCQMQCPQKLTYLQTPSQRTSGRPQASPHDTGAVPGYLSHNGERLASEHYAEAPSAQGYVSVVGSGACPNNQKIPKLTQWGSCSRLSTQCSQAGVGSRIANDLSLEPSFKVPPEMATASTKFCDPSAAVTHSPCEAAVLVSTVSDVVDPASLNPKQASSAALVQDCLASAAVEEG